MSISIGGASLLATLFPISLLIVVVEARAVGGVRGPSYTRGQGARAYRRWLFSARNNWQTINALAVPSAISGTVVCAWHVCTDSPIRGMTVWVLSTAAYQVIAVTMVSLRLLTQLDRMPPTDEAGSARTD